MLKTYTWQSWFAWYPKVFGPHIVWLKHVDRRWDHNEKCWFYRKQLFKC